MGFWANQTKSVIEWKDASEDLLIWRWDGTNDELKNGSKLIVNPGQAAVFVYEGEIKAIHDYPGKFELGTGNVPFWTTIKNIMQNFTSEHKANIFFVRTAEFVNQKWGTKAPITYDDEKYGITVNMRAFGNFSFHITDIRNFINNFSSNRERVTAADVKENIISRIHGPMTAAFAQAQCGYGQVSKYIVELSKKVSEIVAPDFASLGFEMSDFRIESADFDDETKELIKTFNVQSIEGKAAAAKIKNLGTIDQASMSNFAAVEQLKALNTAAGNQNGMAGMGVGMGMGFGMGGMNMGMGAMQQAAQAPQTPMTTCKSCGAQIKANAKFCPECGKPNVAEQTVACIKCGAQIKSGAKFCPECGAPQQTSKKCPKCGADVEGKFCPECGTSM